MNCINLQTLFGSKYRIKFDPSYDPKRIHVKDPWYMQIPCRLGIIYPIGGDKLALEIDYHNGTANKISKIPGVICTQDGHKEKTYQFDVSLFDQIAELVFPKKKRILNLTPEQREAAKERLVRYHVLKKDSGA